MENSFPRFASKSTLTVALLVLGIALTLLPIWFGRFYAIGDIRDVYIPLETFFHQEQLAGRLPVWNPDIAWGFPTIAAAQIGFYYPPLLLLRLLPIYFYLPLLLFLHLALTALGTYLLFRKLGRSSYAAMLGSVSFTLGGFITLHLTHLNILFALAWLPWQLLAIHSISQRPNRRPIHLITIALLIGIPFLAGQIQVPLLMALVAVIWLIAQTRHQYSIVTQIRHVLIISALAIGLTAAQLLPTAELAATSSRNTSGGFDTIRANQHSYPIYHLPTVLFPRFYGNDDTYWGKRLQIEYGFYIGAIPLAFAVLGFIQSLTHKTNRFWMWLLGITFLLALGNLSPFRLLGLEPSLWVFSGPARWLLFTSLAFGFFAAVGADHLVNNPRLQLKTFWRLTVIMLTLVVLGNGLLIIDNIIPGGLISSGPLSFLSPTAIEKLQSMMTSAHTSSVSLASPFTWLTVIIVITALISTIGQRSRYLILGLATLELIIYAAVATPTVPWPTILDPPASIRDLPPSVTTKQARLYSIRDGGDTGAYFTNPESRADALKRAQQRQLLVPLLSSQHGLAGVEWPASLTIADQVTALETMRGQGSLNRSVAANLNVGAVLEYSGNNLKIQELVASPRAQLLDPISNEPISGTTNYNEIHPALQLITVDASQEAKLLIRDTWYAGWSAQVDHQSTVISKEPNNFRSIPVPAGQHLITMSYQPNSTRYGLAISSLTIIGILGVLIIESRRTVQS